MNPSELKDLPQDNMENQRTDIRNKLLVLARKGRISVAEKSIRECKPDILEKMKLLYDAVRLKKFSRTLTGKFVFVGSKLLEKVKKKRTK